MGGIAVNLFNDLNFGIPPLNMALVRRMVENTKVYKMLSGYGGLSKVDMNAILLLLNKISYLVADFPQIQANDYWQVWFELLAMLKAFPLNMRLRSLIRGKA
jgi:acetyltransferase